MCNPTAFTAIVWIWIHHAASKILGGASKMSCLLRAYKLVIQFLSSTLSTSNRLGHNSPYTSATANNTNDGCWILEMARSFHQRGTRGRYSRPLYHLHERCCPTRERIGSSPRDCSSFCHHYTQLHRVAIAKPSSRGPQRDLWLRT